MASSSSSSSSSSTSSAQLSQISSLLTSIKSNPKDNQLFHQAFQLCSSYCSDSGGGKSFDSHPFCSTDGRDPDLQGEIQSAMLKAFGLARNKEVDDWLSGIGKSIHACTDCYLGFEKAREDLNQNYLWSYSPDKVANFNAHIDQWEESLALEKLSSLQPNPGFSKAALQPSETFAILSILSSSNATKLTSRFAEILNSETDRLQVAGKEVPASILRFLLEGRTKEEVEIKNWLRSQFYLQEMFDESSRGKKPEKEPSSQRVSQKVESIIEKVKQRISTSNSSGIESLEEQQSVWETIIILLHLSPDSSSSLAPSILAHLHDKGSHFLLVLRSFSQLLTILGPDVWTLMMNGSDRGLLVKSGGIHLMNGNSDTSITIENDELPAVILSSILDNVAYLDSLSLDPTKGDVPSRDLLFSWMDSMLRSLHLRDVEHYASSGVEVGAASDGSGQFGEVYKRLANFLFERTQQSHVPRSCRLTSLERILSLLTSYHRELTAQELVKEVVEEGIGKGKGKEVEEGSKPQIIQPSSKFLSKKDPINSKHLEVIFKIFTIYAPEIAILAMKGKTRNTNEIVKSSSSSRRSALRLLKQVFERDAQVVRAAALELGHLSDYHSRVTWKSRGKKSKDENGKLVQIKGPSADQIYSMITKDFSFSDQVRISDELWQESYKQLDSRSDSSCASVFLSALSTLSIFADNGPDLEQEVNNHLLKVSINNQPKSFANYKSNVKSVVKAISRALTSMRHEFKDTLVDYSETASEDEIQQLCCEKASDLLKLGLSPDPLMHKTMQTLIRSGYSNAESRADCFKVLFQVSPSQALKGLGDFLYEFVLAARTLTQANEAAKWVIRSAADVLDVLCSPADGILRPGIKYSLLSSARQSVIDLLPGIWKMMCEALATIFTNAPRWSVLLDKRELTAWLRDVNIFGGELVEQLPVVQQAYATTSGHANSSTLKEMNANLAMPVQVSISFLRLNEDEILHESLNFVHRALEHFNSKNPLPVETKNVMMDWIQKMLDQPIKERNTLLTTDQLQDLQDRLDPEARLSRKEIITIDDDEEETESGVTSAASSPRSGSFSSSHTSVDKKESQKKKQLKQSKLNFASAIDEPKKKKAAPPAPPLSKAFPVSGAPVVATNNRYQAAGMVPKPKDNGRSSGSGSNSLISQMRSDFNSNRSWKGSTANSSASTSKTLPRPTVPDDKSDTTDSDESSEDDEEPKGLRALTIDREAAVKKISKSVVAPLHKRSTQILANPDQERRQREREEQERRRMLKKAPDYSPLYESILSSSYYHDSQDLPSITSQSAPALFPNSDEYMNTFIPMILLETWAQILQAKEQIQNGSVKMFPVEIQNRTNIDRGLEIGVTLPADLTITSQSRFSDQDVVVLREKVDPMTARKGSLPKAVLAKVKEFKMQRTGPRITLLCYLQNDRQGASVALVGGSRWEVGKLISLTTTHREYAALSSIQYYPLRDQILRAQTTTKARLSKSEIEDAKDLYGLNEPQASAVIASLKEPGFSLIQGPPGTGKTSTICGLVSAFINSRKAPPVSLYGGQTKAAAVKKKILVCAPSNAAIDEIAKRLQTSLKDSNGNQMKINIVRTGRDETINVSVKEISLEALIDKRISELNSNSSGNGGTDPRVLQEEIRKLNSDRSSKEAELNAARVSSSNVSQVHQLENELRIMKSKRSKVMARLDEAKDKQQDNFRQRDAETRKVRVDILTEADVICSTLGSAGHESLAGLAFDFETVIIDEAAQAREVESLIPLRYNCRQCILVGDPLQLPPTVISKPADKLKYGRSLFVRMFDKAAERVHLLSIQYRMHPEISIFPSRTFYDSKLQDGPNMARLTAQPWHSDPLLKPFKFFSTSGHESEGRGHSKINREEMEVALAIYQRLMRDYSNYDFDRKVGIVAAYKEQVFELRKAFRSRYGESIFDRVDFNTVDGFQGQEKSIIIFSCVRAGTGTIGFLSSFERLNVAITRAKSNLFIIGNAPELRKDQLWSRLVTNAEEVGALQAVNVKTFQSAKSKAAISSGAGSSTLPNVPIGPKAQQNSFSPEEVKKRTASMRDASEAGASSVETSNKKKKEVDDRKENPTSVKRKENEAGVDSSSAPSKRSRIDDSSKNTASTSSAANGSSKATTKKSKSSDELFDLMGMSSKAGPPTVVTTQRRVVSNTSHPSTSSSSTSASKPNTNPTTSNGQARQVPSVNGATSPSVPRPPPPKPQAPPKGPARPSSKALGALFAPKRPPPKR